MLVADSICQLFSRRRCHCRLICRKRGRCRYEVLTVFLVMFVTLYMIINLRNYDLYTASHPFFSAQTCKYLNKKEKDHLLNMTYTVHKILDDLGIEHWLMYGSVFGAIRAQGPLPWDDDVDVGFNSSGTFASTKFVDFVSAFESKGLKVYHARWFTSNMMKVYSDDMPLIKVDLTAMYNYNGWMKRGGLETWIVPFHYNRRHTFPAELAEKPLPLVRFGYSEMPVPRGGIEIQKYLYPDDWWKEVKPVSCE
ncbi:uncharacterized protein LOC144662488 [Oculina patagonica]